jgi:bifunctional non-homologous end joining protein LigD
MSLREYKRKRDFHRTPEPAGGDAAKHETLQFVIQKHAASRLHYDFRLEWDGTLKSWAVPKGPSLDPAAKSLAVAVEDHPLEYADFEGIIPEGQYGGGTVLVWDRGSWEPEGDAGKSLRNGKLSFQLKGEKLRGGWSLVRMSGRAGDDGKNWLLIKRLDKFARPDAKSSILERKPRSVLSDRSLDEIAAHADRIWYSKQAAAETNGRARTRPIESASRRSGKPKSVKRGRSTRTNAGANHLSTKPGKSPGARRARQPTSLRPQLATLAASVPLGDRWIHEIKFDGYRILAFLQEGEVKLITRQGQDWTQRFRRLADAFAKLPVRDGILDGEIVALNADGISEFQRLQNSLKRGDDNSLACYFFDLPWCQGFNLTPCSLLERKQLLRDLVLADNPQNDGTLRYSDHIVGQGDEVLQHACRGAMEGIVSKLADSPYQAGRTRDWLKIKCLKRQEFVIGGFSKASGSRIGFGALLLGYFDGNKLIYCGRVGTGFTAESLRELKTELKKRIIDSPRFAVAPAGADRRGVTWVKPELVGEVEFTEWTQDGRLRHPSFQGLREDKSPRSVVREAPAMNNGRAITSSEKSASPVRSSQRQKKAKQSAGQAPTTVAGITITHPDRVIYAMPQLTKFDVAGFYEQIADRILPHVVGRPLTIVRCPEGEAGECFYQKHLTGTVPEAVHSVSILEKSSRGQYVVIDDLGGLISLVQIGALEFHPWPARADDVERPDRLIFDLDPGEGVAWKNVIDGAREVREMLSQLGLRSFVRTSGGKGLHVVVPLARRNTWDELKAFAKGIADTLTAQSPTRYIATMSKGKRHGKVFIDYLRNQRGATAIASYSTRSRPGAAVATPLSWDELSARIKPDAYRVTNLLKRLESLPEDPWEEFFATKQSLSKKALSAVQDGTRIARR